MPVRVVFVCGKGVGIGEAPPDDDDDDDDEGRNDGGMDAQARMYLQVRLLSLRQHWAHVQLCLGCVLCTCVWCVCVCKSSGNRPKWRDAFFGDFFLLPWRATDPLTRK